MADGWNVTGATEVYFSLDTEVAGGGVNGTEAELVSLPHHYKDRRLSC